MPGRAAFYSGAEIGLKNTFQFVFSEDIAKEYEAIITGNDVEYTVTGIIIVETSWSMIEKEFQSTLNI